MTVYKCKICAGTLDIKPGEMTCVCDYCGVEQSVPHLINTKAEEIYNRACVYLVHNEFDKAENLYNQLLIDNKRDADAYWNVLMCRYGVTYVKDPKTEEYVPTCNRTMSTSIFKDPNYVNAIRFADEHQKSVFQNTAAKIDRIQKKILSVCEKEKPFDIFISYKELEPNGGRTRDSIEAQDLYNKLTEAGYKVFFSRITLEGKVGTDYEPYIYAALASSKVMITICSSKENIESTWVMNEWSRYLSFAQSDKSKTLIPLYFNMKKSDLPDEFSNLPAYNMRENGFEQELLRGVKKLIPLPIMVQERKKQMRKRMRIVGIAALVLAVIGGIASVPWFCKLPAYNDAMNLYYEHNYPKAAWAFAELGGFRDSADMKLKAEKSWRRSLADVAVRNYLSSSSSGSYFITSNGNIEAFQGDPGHCIGDNEIDEHGAIVSIASNRTLYALHEDGYVKVENYEKDAEEWENIIQISSVFNSANVALKSDGTMVASDMASILNPDNEDHWLAGISEWKNIVQFDYSYDRYGFGGIDAGLIIGVQADGELCYVSQKALSAESQAALKNFHDVKEISVFPGYNDLSADGMKLNIVAVTSDNKILKYSDSSFSEYESDDVIEVLGDGYYTEEGVKIVTLLKDGRLVALGSSISLVEDVVHLCKEGFAITRSGSVYALSDQVYDVNAKTTVFDEWVERIN